MWPVRVGQQAKADLGRAHPQGQHIGYDVIDRGFVLEPLRYHEVVHALADGIEEWHAQHRGRVETGHARLRRDMRASVAL